MTNAGSVDLNESVANPNPNAPTYPLTAELVDGEADVSLAIRIEEDQPYDTVTIEMCSFDDKNEETGRTFHTTMQIILSFDQIKAVRHFLSYLIDARELIVPT